MICGAPPAETPTKGSTFDYKQTLDKRSPGMYPGLQGVLDDQCVRQFTLLLAAHGMPGPSKIDEALGPPLVGGTLPTSHPPGPRADLSETRPPQDPHERAQTTVMILPQVHLVMTFSLDSHVQVS